MSSYAWRVSKVRRIAHAYRERAHESACGDSALALSEQEEAETTAARCVRCLDLVAADRREYGVKYKPEGSPWRRRGGAA